MRFGYAALARVRPDEIAVEDDGRVLPSRQREDRFERERIAVELADDVKRMGL
jgi:hypothetical protein